MSGDPTLVDDRGPWVAPARPVWPVRYPAGPVLMTEQVGDSWVEPQVLDRFVEQARAVGAAVGVSASETVVPEPPRSFDDARPVRTSPQRAEEWVGRFGVPDLTRGVPAWVLLVGPPACGARWRPRAGAVVVPALWCTRMAGHTGRHAAGDQDEIVAVWGDRP